MVGGLKLETGNLKLGLRVVQPVTLSTCHPVLEQYILLYGFAKITLNIHQQKTRFLLMNMKLFLFWAAIHSAVGTARPSPSIFCIKGYSGACTR